MVTGFCLNAYIDTKAVRPNDSVRQIQLLLDGINRSLFAVSAQSLESENTVACSKEGVVAALAYVCAGMDLCTSLTNEHVACEHELTVASLDAKTLGF